ncbi:MAG: hypothetical protein U0Q03_13710 [Acidimicrobiales bacterium]
MTGRRGRGTLARRTLVATFALGSVVVVAGCVGSIDRTEFDDLVHERGGGLSGDLVVAGLTAIADESDDPSVAVYSITLTSNTVSFSVQSPDFDDEVNGWTYLLNGDLLGPDPEPNIDSGGAPVTFDASAVDVEALEDSIDQAVEQTSVRRGWASSASLFAEPGGGFELRVNITNDRADETFVFGSDGTLRGVS